MMGVGDEYDFEEGKNLGPNGGYKRFWMFLRNLSFIQIVPEVIIHQQVGVVI